MVVEIASIKIYYKATRISHAVVELIMNFYFCTEDLGGFGGTLPIFLFYDLSLSAGS